jgi:hypothetical protein
VLSPGESDKDEHRHDGECDPGGNGPGGAVIEELADAQPAGGEPDEHHASRHDAKRQSFAVRVKEVVPQCVPEVEGERSRPDGVEYPNGTEREEHLTVVCERERDRARTRRQGPQDGQRGDAPSGPSALQIVLGAS